MGFLVIHTDPQHTDFRHEQAETWLKGNGGLRARILTDGILRRDPPPAA